MRRLLPIVLALCACGQGGGDLCTRSFKPLPDMIGERPRTTANAPLLDAMAAYRQGDYATAAAGLATVIERDGNDRMARLFLASALIGAGEPYKAEMHLDFLERVPGQPFKDQTEWLNAVCWLCSGQQARALEQCRRLAQRPSHTYKAEAQALARALEAR